MKQKRILSVQDISCFGKCSLTVALPVLSAMGLECCVLPTALLSAHTGCFDEYFSHELSGDIPKIAEHWLMHDIRFDSIYTGYLSSREQVDILAKLFHDFSPVKIYVDPAMADNGELYSGLDADFPKKMAELCRYADVIVPNLTEAAMLLDSEYPGDEYDIEYIKATLMRLTRELGCKCAVITGVVRGGLQGAVAYDRLSHEFTSYFAKDLPVKYPGTGDVFSSTFFGAMTLQGSLASSMKLAVDYTHEALRASLDDSERKYGVKFEAALPRLIKMINKNG